MSEHAASPAERIVRGSALAAMIALAAGLVFLGLALHRPFAASAEPSNSVSLNAEPSAGERPCAPIRDSTP